MEITKQVEKLFLENKDKINFVGFSSEVINWTQKLLNNKCEKNYFITEGLWAVDKIIINKCEVVAFVFCEKSIKSSYGIKALKYFLKSSKVYAISEKVLNKLTKRNDDSGIYCIVKTPQYNVQDILSKDKAIVGVLDGIEKAGNIGTIFRTADGCGIDMLMIVNSRAKVNNVDSVKSSMGAIFNVPFKIYGSVEECFLDISNNGFDIYLSDTSAKQNYFNCSYPNKTALVLGSERYGVDKFWYSHKHSLIKIEMLGQSDSLNVGVAAGILLYDIKMKSK